MYAMQARDAHAEESLEVTPTPRVDSPCRDVHRAGAVGGGRSEAPSACVENSLQLTEIFVSNQLVDEPDVLEDESGPGPQRVVAALERRGDHTVDVPARGDETLAGCLAYPPRAVGQERHQERCGGERRDRRCRAARMGANQRIGVLEQTQCAAQCFPEAATRSVSSAAARTFGEDPRSCSGT